jgi:acetolactate synthase-1/2/3 large subunit
VQAAAALLHAARRPLIVARGGVVASGARRRGARAGDSAARAGRADADGARRSSPATAGTSSVTAALIAGDAVKRAFDEADAIVAIGCRFSSWMWDERGPVRAPPSPARQHQHRSVVLGAPALHEVAMQADAGSPWPTCCRALGDAPAAGAADWLPALKAVRTDYEARLAANGRRRRRPDAPGSAGAGGGRGAAARCHRRLRPRPHQLLDNDLTPVHEVRTRFHDPGMSQLGFGLPYAMALQRVHPGKAVVTSPGDGAFGFTMQELDSARRNRLPVVNVIHNNAAWGIIRAGQRDAARLRVGHLASRHRLRGHRARLRLPRRDGRARRRRRRRARARRSRSGLPAVLDCRTKFFRIPPCRPSAA